MAISKKSYCHSFSFISFRTRLTYFLIDFIKRHVLYTTLARLLSESIKGFSSPFHYIFTVGLYLKWYFPIQYYCIGKNVLCRICTHAKLLAE